MSDLREELWQAIVDVRDAHPRVTDDVDSWEIVDAVLKVRPIARIHPQVDIEDLAAGMYREIWEGQRSYADASDDVKEVCRESARRIAKLIHASVLPTREQILQRAVYDNEEMWISIDALMDLLKGDQS